MKTLVYGSLNIDLVYQVDHVIRPGETGSSIRMARHAGGKGLNQAIAAAKAGAQTYFAGCIGTDGAFLKAMLEKHGINTDHLRQKEMQSGNAIIQVDRDGQNAILLFGGSNQAVTEEEIDEILAHFGKGDLLLMQNEISCGRALLEKARRAGLTVAVNPSPITDDLLCWPLGLADYLLVNEIEGEALTGTADIRQMIEMLKSRYPETNVVLTLGEHGAYSIFKDAVFFEPARRVKVVDTTAAGDTFTGYYLQSIREGESVQNALRCAAKAASIAIGIPGAAESIPSRDQVSAE